MRPTWRMLLTIAVVLVLAIAALSFLFVDLSGKERTEGSVASFAAKGYDESTVSLANSSGRFTVVHITQFEYPLCIGCEGYVIEQIKELEKLGNQNDSNIDIITLNVRKNPASIEGWKMAIEILHINITWGWIEEVSNYPASSQFLDYATVDGGMANPTLLIIDDQLRVVDIEHVYSVATGKIDGVQTYEMIQSKIARLASGQATDPSVGIAGGDSLTFGGMLVLGIITSFSPCSIALLMTMISYIGSMKEREGSRSRPAGRLAQGIGIGTAFTLGMALVFLFIGLFISYIGEFIRMSTVFYLIAGFVLVLLGVNSIKPLSGMLKGLHWLARSDDRSLAKGPDNGGIVGTGQRMINALAVRSRYLASFLLGIMFSIGWAPCALTLVFPVIVLIMTQDISILTGGALMFVFGLGHGLVIIPFCAATGEMKGRMGNKYIKAGNWIKTGFGIAIIVLGLLFAARYFGYFLW